MSIFIVSFSRENCKIILGAFSIKAKAVEFVLEQVKSSRYEILNDNLILDFSHNSAYDIYCCNVDFLCK